MNVDSKTSPGTTVAKLVLTAKSTGSANSFSVDASGGDSRFNLNETTSANFATTNATNANVLIDPQAVAATAQNSVANVEFTSTDVVAPGFISFKDSKGAVNFSVNIVSGSNDTLPAITSAINNAPGNNSVTASIINVASQVNPGTSVSKLVFTAKQPGIDNKFSIDAAQGDSRLTLDASPVNAQQSVSATAFTATDKVAPGTLTFKDTTGTAVFSVTVASDVTTTVDSNGNAIPVDANGNLVIPTDVNGNPVATTTQTVTGNDTLAQLRDAINYNPDNKLVSASIVSSTTAATTVDSGQVDSSGNPILTPVPAQTTSKLVLTALNSGTDKGFTVDGSAGDTRFTLDPINVPTNFATTTTTSTYDTTSATNAGDGGQLVTQSSNSIINALPGVTLNLVAVGSADINVQQDKAAISQPISAFVDAYNKFNDSLKQLTNYVGPGNSGNGALLGDSTLQGIISQVKLIINSKASSATGDYNSLNQLGISFDKKGVMSLDNTKLQAALSANLTSVGDVFSSTNGIATQLNTKITQYLDSKGVLSTEESSLNKQLAQLTTEKAAVNTRLAATQKGLQAQFIAMDSAVAQFKNTGTYLTQALTPKTTA
jgi:flagellar hook-associated protein 2